MDEMNSSRIPPNAKERQKMEAVPLDLNPLQVPFTHFAGIPVAAEPQHASMTEHSSIQTMQSQVSIETHSVDSLSTMNSRASSYEWNASLLRETDVQEEETDEIMFRQDPAWTRSMRKSLPKSGSCHSLPTIPEDPEPETRPAHHVGSFESELEKTAQWMSGSSSNDQVRVTEVKIVEKVIRNFDSSERSRDYDRFLPTSTPSFLGDVIKDADLDAILQSLIADLNEEDCLEATSAGLEMQENGYLSEDTSIATTCLTESSSASKKKKSKKKNKKKKSKKQKAAMGLADAPNPEARKYTVPLDATCQEDAINTPLIEGPTEFWANLHPSLPVTTLWRFIEYIVGALNFHIISLYSAYTDIVWNESENEPQMILKVKTAEDSAPALDESQSHLNNFLLSTISDEGIRPVELSPGDLIRLSEESLEKAPPLHVSNCDVNINRIQSFLAGRNTETKIACLTFRQEHAKPIFKFFTNPDGQMKLHAIRYHAFLTLEVAKSLSPLSIEDALWEDSILEMSHSVPDNGWFSVAFEAKDDDLESIATIIDSLAEGEPGVPSRTAILSTNWPSVAQHLKIALEDHVLQRLIEDTDITAKSEDVVCLLRWSLFVSLGQILKKAQSDGFVLAGMQSTRLNKGIISQMTSPLSDDTSELDQKVLKTMCPGPVIILWLKKEKGLRRWLDVLECVYGKSQLRLPIYSEGFMAPNDDQTAHHWSGIFFPNGPTVNIEYQIQYSQLVKLQTQHYFINSLFNLTHRRAPFQKHFETLTFIFYSQSLYSEENTDKWGTIMDAILSLRSRHSQIRLEKCNFVNLTDEFARYILSTGSLDSTKQKSMHFELTKGPCLIVRFGGPPSLCLKLKQIQDISLNAFVYYEQHLDDLYDRMHL